METECDKLIILSDIRQYQGGASIDKGTASVDGCSGLRWQVLLALVIYKYVHETFLLLYPLIFIVSLYGELSNQGIKFLRIFKYVIVRKAYLSSSRTTVLS